jgi:hypothetical protein
MWERMQTFIDFVCYWRQFVIINRGPKSAGGVLNEHTLQLLSCFSAASTPLINLMMTDKVYNFVAVFNDTSSIMYNKNTFCFLFALTISLKLRLNYGIIFLLKIELHNFSLVGISWFSSDFD